MKLFPLALVIFLTSCGVHISPVPGVSVHIPVPHEQNYHERDSRSRDSHSESKSEHHERD